MGNAVNMILFLCSSCIQCDHSSWKVIEFSKTIFLAWKVMENSQGHEKG